MSEETAETTDAYAAAMTINQTVEEASILADRLAFYDESVGRAGADRGYDYAIHMTDPSANADEFDDKYDKYVAEMENGLAHAKAAMDAFVREHRGALAIAGWSDPRTSEEQTGRRDNP